MKTLKISVVATFAAILCWRVKLPQKLWPAHPQLADVLIAVILCVVLQVTWPDEERKGVAKKSESEKKAGKSD